jgi:hypothetical protein
MRGISFHRAGKGCIEISVRHWNQPFSKQQGRQELLPKGIENSVGAPCFSGNRIAFGPTTKGYRCCFCLFVLSEAGEGKELEDNRKEFKLYVVEQTERLQCYSKV